jgi:hypothetical protein
MMIVMNIRAAGAPMSQRMPPLRDFLIGGILRSRLSGASPGLEEHLGWNAKTLCQHQPDASIRHGNAGMVFAGREAAQIKSGDPRQRLAGDAPVLADGPKRAHSAFGGAFDDCPCFMVAHRSFLHGKSR